MYTEFKKYHINRQLEIIKLKISMEVVGLINATEYIVWQEIIV